MRRNSQNSENRQLRFDPLTGFYVNPDNGFMFSPEEAMEIASCKHSEIACSDRRPTSLVDKVAELQERLLEVAILANEDHDFRQEVNPEVEVGETIPLTKVVTSHDKSGWERVEWEKNACEIEHTIHPIFTDKPPWRADPEVKDLLWTLYELIGSIFFNPAGYDNVEELSTMIGLWRDFGSTSWAKGGNANLLSTIKREITSLEISRKELQSRISNLVAKNKKLRCKSYNGKRHRKSKLT